MSKKKEILVVYILTKLELGGAQKVCLSLFNGFKNLDDFSSFLISSTDGILVDQVKNLSSVCLLKSLKRELSLKSIFTEIGAFWDLFKELKRIKKDNPDLQIIVHTHSTKAGILGRWAALFAGIKNRIHTIHGYAFHKHQSYLSWLFHFIPEFITSLITKHFICVSSEDVKLGIKLFPKFKNKHSIIRAASIESDKFNSSDIRSENFPENNEIFVFGTISCFKPQKNLIDLLKAFNYVHHKNPNTRLEIIGDGEQRDAVMSWIKSHDLEHSVILHGWQSNVIDKMKNWHAFVLSSLWEGLPCSIIEARMIGLPVLSYNTGGIKDIISSGQNGILYEMSDWQSLSKGMFNLTCDKELFYSLKNYKEDLTDFKDVSMLDQHNELYKKLVL